MPQSVSMTKLGKQKNLRHVRIQDLASQIGAKERETQSLIWAPSAHLDLDRRPQLGNMRFNRKIFPNAIGEHIQDLIFPMH